MDARAKAIAALEKAGAVLWQNFPNGVAAYRLNGYEATFYSSSMALNYGLLSALTSSLSPEEIQRLALIRNHRRDRSPVYQEDTAFLLSLIDRLTGGKSDA